MTIFFLDFGDYDYALPYIYMTGCAVFMFFPDIRILTHGMKVHTAVPNYYTTSFFFLFKLKPNIIYVKYI